MFKSYKSLFKINFAIYEVMGHQLPRPIYFDTLALFIVFFMLNLFLFKIIPINNPFIWNFVVSSIMCYIFSQFNLQGKMMVIWLLDFVMFIFRHKTTNFRGEKISDGETVKNWRSIKI
jgi:hypothetical protein